MRVNHLKSFNLLQDTSQDMASGWHGRRNGHSTYRDTALSEGNVQEVLIFSYKAKIRNLNAGPDSVRYFAPVPEGPSNDMATHGG